ncbi:terpene synthase family protein [Streptomyces sp. 8N114]|uniref:terpene synthase family protein n=1 Tax=Streptomyces sp. 8N114 TaxID=3457419 RepID=UPI003FD1A7C3
MLPQFDIPSSERSNTYRGDAEQANLLWLREHGMLRSEAATERYRSWRLADLSSRCWPTVGRADLVLAVDLKAFYFLFDDQFDRPDLTGITDRVRSVCDELCAILHGRGSAGRETPLTAAFADLWRRARHGMTPAWRARAAHDWERYFCAQSYEALAHDRYPEPALDEYYAVRGGTAATESVLDMVERLVHAEPPGLAWHSPHLRLLRKTAAEVPFITNDVYSCAKEAARGDAYNLVAVLRRTGASSLSEATSQIERLVRQSVHRFFVLHDELPTVCADLLLDQAQTNAVLAYGEGLANWLRGHNDWMMTTARYAAASTRSAAEPGYDDDLLAPWP